MPDSHALTVGGVLSADIAVPEHERVLHFYSRVLTTGGHPLWRDDLMNNLGVPVIGLGKRTSEHADLPIQWMPHIQVADVALSAERATALGGRELMHHRDDRGDSRWAVLLDPNGAAFGIIPVVAPESLPPGWRDASSGAVGRISRLDLTVSDGSNARDFYSEVVGWFVQDIEMQDASGRYVDYALCTADGTSVARVRHSRGVGRVLPEVWMIGVPVGDLGESLDRARASGGEVVDVRRGSNGEAVYAVLRDPAGACLAVVPS